MRINRQARQDAKEENTQRRVQTKHKPYDQMNAEELAKATAEVDQEILVPRGRPTTPARRQKFNRVRHRTGRTRR
jgi:hypothetical protein